MNRELAEAVVECFQLGEETPEVSRLRNFNAREWQRTYGWLDRSGLALYLLRRLQDLGATELLPPEVRVRFERNDVENRRRLEYITSEFDSINQRFQRAGINFAVIKGFSLIPGFCPDVTLRAPSDLDYLVGQESVAAAQRALEEEGYCLQRMSEIEFKFGKPSAQSQFFLMIHYSPADRATGGGYAHLAFWNTKKTGWRSMSPSFRLDQTISHHWQGLRFPGLEGRRCVCFASTPCFPAHVGMLGEIVLASGDRVLCAGTVLRSTILGPRRHSNARVSLSCGVRGGCYGTGRKSVRCSYAADRGENGGSLFVILLAAYGWKLVGRTWAIEDHPYLNSSLFAVSKLAFLLHREFIPDPKIRQEITRRRLFPWKVPEQIAIPAVLTGGRGQRQFLWRRLIFHLGSSLRYCWELPRWRRLARLQSHELL